MMDQVGDLYQVTVQMFGSYTVTSKLKEEIEKHFSRYQSRDILDVVLDTRSESHSLQFAMESIESTSKVKQLVHDFLVNHQGIYYMDVQYLIDDCWNFVPNRFVVWRDGSERHFVGKLSFEEIE